MCYPSRNYRSGIFQRHLENWASSRKVHIIELLLALAHFLNWSFTVMNKIKESASAERTQEQEQISKMKEIIQLVLVEMNTRSENLDNIADSCDNLIEQLRAMRRQAKEVSAKLESLSQVVDVKTEAVNPTRLPLPKVLPTPKVMMPIL